MCGMLSILRSQKANQFQLIIGMFLLASGSAKREIEVLAHAGISVSYSTIMNKVHELSVEGTQTYRNIAANQMVYLIWDNINIAQRVEAERLNSKSTFENGTAATMIPLWDPINKTSETQLGTLPLDSNPPRTTTLPIIDDFDIKDTLPTPEGLRQLTECCVWQLKRIVIEHLTGLERLKESLGPCPEVDQIDVHETKQYPLHAKHLDESTLDGTAQIYKEFLEEIGMTEEEVKKHGLLFIDGDLLTDSLLDKVRLKLAPEWVGTEVLI